jgi:membrane-associated phospholipid phosphatase
MSASPHGTDGHGPETDLPLQPAADVPPQHDASTYDKVDRLTGEHYTRRRIRDQIGARSRGIAIALTVGFLYVLVDIFVEGPLTQLDIKVNDWNGQKAMPSLDSAAWAYDKMGQRSVLVPILLLVAGYFARKHRTWRPVVLAAMSFLVLNVVVGAMKILIGRSQTETGDPSVLQGDIIFPSGHSSNMVLTGGVIVYLMLRYGKNPPVRLFAAVWSALTVLTILTSLYIGSHWLTDLVAGALVGGLLLQSVILFDIATKDVRYTRPWWWRRTVALLPFLETHRERPVPADALVVDEATGAAALEREPAKEPSPHP